MTPDKDNLIRKILKLFALGSASSGTTEAEMMAAITQAKVMMARHDISEAAIQQAANEANAKAKTKIEYNINSYTAYTRKMKSLARYDEVVAVCVERLTSTKALVTRTSTANGNYVSIKFVGTEMDANVASALFMIFLPAVRARARAVFGSAKWDKQHTSYAIGFATRMAQRASEMADGLTPEEKTSTALTIRTKADAIGVFLGKSVVMSGFKRRDQSPDAIAWGMGYHDGANFNLGKRGIT